PILSSLQLRADWAAADERLFPSLTRLAGDPSPAVRSAAVEALRDVLASRIMPGNRAQLEGVAAVLRKMPEPDKSSTHVRLAALESLGHLLALRVNVAWAQEFLISQLTAAETNSERVASVKALAHLANPQSVAAVLDALAKLPLDELTVRQTAYARAA